MLKIKVAFGQDLRLFKFQGTAPSEVFDALKEFVSQTFELERFRLQYEDEENDLITVSSDQELDEAFDSAAEQGKTLKLFVVAIVAQEAAVVSPPQSEEKSEIPPTTIETTVEPTQESQESQESADGWQGINGLKQLLVEDESFRQEFSAFAQDVVIQLREGDDFQTAVQTGLAAHDELANHAFVRDTFVPMLPVISEKAAFATPFLKNIEPTAVPGLIEQAVGSLQGGENMLPMMMQMFAGGMGGAGETPGGFPPFGGMGAPNDPRMGAFGGFPFGGQAAQQGSGPWGHPHGFGRGRGWGGRGRGWHGRGGGRGRGWHADGAQTEMNPPPNDGSPASQSYLADVVDESVTLVDGAVVLPGSSVVKTWRIRNSGEVAYPEGTKLKYVGRPFNELVDGAEFPAEPVPPGGEGEVSALLSTPNQAGRFGSAWRLHLPDGTPFGPMLQARVLVVNQAVQPTLAVDDDMGDIYDVQDDAKLEDMVAEQARLQADLADIGSQINETQVENERPIVSTLPMSTPGNENSAVDDVGPSVETTEADAFVQELEELANMGFDDLALNRMLLRTNNGELDVVLNLLCELRA